MAPLTEEPQAHCPENIALNMKTTLSPRLRCRHGVPLLLGLIIAQLMGGSTGSAFTTNVNFSNYAYNPNKVVIHVGDTVNWINQGGFHTVTGDGADAFCGNGAVATSCAHTFLAAGTFPYHCVFHTAFGMTGTVTVLPAPLPPPTIRLVSPGDNTVYPPPATIALQATASSSNGAIARVDFYSSGHLLGTATTAPFSLLVSNLPADVYSFSAIAVDSAAMSATSLVARVTVAAIGAYAQHSLVSDIPGLADQTDANLVNAWGIATSPTGPFWVTANHSGTSTIYNTTGGVQSLVVTIPPPSGQSPPSGPTGIVFNNTPDFILDSNGKPAAFIFSTENGTIAAWNAGTTAVIKGDNSGSEAIYKGLALAKDGAKSFLYASDFHNGRIDVFDSTFGPVATAGGFVDPSIPDGFAPFNAQNIDGNLFVTYAKQDAEGHDHVSGLGNGFVNVFDPAGHLLKRFASNGWLNSPWGLAVAPDGFGPFSGALLIGNFGDGRIHAFDRALGTPLGTLADATGSEIAIPGLWGLKFGNGGNGGAIGTLYFAAGIPGDGAVEDHGLFGSIAPSAPLQIAAATVQGENLVLRWLGGTGPFHVQKKGRIPDTSWTDVTTTTDSSVQVRRDSDQEFFRIVDQSP